MATVSYALANIIAANDGYYMDDPRVVRIVEYTDMGGKLAYGLEYEHQRGKYSESPYVRNPTIFWSDGED